MKAKGHRDIWMNKGEEPSGVPSFPPLLAFKPEHSHAEARKQYARRRSTDSAHDPASKDRLLDVQEAASRLSLKPKTLYRWAYERRIPVVKLGGLRGALRFRLSDLNALIAHSVRPALESALDAI